MSAKRVLFVSYDGMTDPLGQSQVLPYLIGLSGRGYEFDLISCEKPSRLDQHRTTIDRMCRQAGIRWHPVRFLDRPPILAAGINALRMRRLAERLHRRRKFDLVHGRSDIASLAALHLKRRHHVPFLYDMRAFWPDERVDGGSLRLSNPVHAFAYRFLKKRQADYLKEADHVVSLTEAAKSIVLGRPNGTQNGPAVTVIPCCADFTHFAPIDAERRASARELLGIAPNRRVAAYLGSIGSWYMLDEMLDFFKVQLERASDSLFLLVTRDDPEGILHKAVAKGVAAGSILIRGATRDEVPLFLAAADYGIFFIKPVFSKKASSPTKMGEFLALELPIVTNGRVGDVSRIVDETGAGVVVEHFEKAAYRDALDGLERLQEQGFDYTRWRERSRHWFDLATGVQRYDSIYREAATLRNTSTSRGA